MKIRRKSLNGKRILKMKFLCMLALFSLVNTKFWSGIIQENITPEK